MTASKLAAVAAPADLCRWCGGADAAPALAGFCCAAHAQRWEHAAATAPEREAAEYLAGQRNPENLIAAALGVTAAAWARLRKGDGALREALSRGRAREHLALVNSLFEEATADAGPSSVTAAVFLLKTRHGYTDKAESEPSRVQVAIVLPAALTDAQYAELRRVAGAPADRRELVDVTPRELAPGGAA